MGARLAHPRLLPLALAALALTLFGGSPALAATGDQPDSIGIRLAEIPADARNDPRARIYIVDHLAPGTTIERSIEVCNTAGSQNHIELYAGAATIEAGAFIGAAERTQNDLSSWTTVSPGGGDIAANGTATATVTIDVPADAAPGEHYAVVWAEVRAAEDAGGVVQVNRVGIRIYLSVGPGGPPAADFTIESLTASRASDGSPVVVATVQNTGGRALDMSGTLLLEGGPGGLTAGPFEVRLGTTLGVGDTEPVTVELDSQLPAGPWDASITLHSGLLEITANATITFPESGVAAPVEARGDERWLLYVVLAGFVLFMLAAATAMIIARRRSRLVSA